MATDPLAPVGRALISVSDKTGLIELGLALTARGIEIVSTGGTAAALAQAGVAVVEVAGKFRIAVKERVEKDLRFAD